MAKQMAARKGAMATTSVNPETNRLCRFVCRPVRKRMTGKKVRAKSTKLSGDNHLSRCLIPLPQPLAQSNGKSAASYLAPNWEAFSSAPRCSKAVLDGNVSVGLSVIEMTRQRNTLTTRMRGVID